MRKLWVSFMMMAVILAGLGIASAQGPGLPPTIISFASDLESISMADAEAGETTAVLSWEVVGLKPDMGLALYTYRFSAWQPLPLDEPLPANGSTTITVEHTRNFAPPTYNLTIIDGQGAPVDQRVLVIPYDESAISGPPQIESFTSTEQTLDITEVATGVARVFVHWTVSNRGPLDNIVFEQVVEGGDTISVELPRPNLWIASEGDGVLAPVLPRTSATIQLQMRVVDMRDGTTRAEQTLPPIEVTGSLPPTPAPTPTIAPTARVLSFEAAPNTATRGSAVTVSWQVTGSTKIGVWLVDGSGRMAASAPNPAPSGSWTVTLPDYFSGQADFMIFADDASGIREQSSLSVRIVCSATYFFPTTPDTVCPQGESREVQAAYEEFENGYMIWRADMSDIYALVDTGEAYHIKDRWQGEMISFPEPEPPGLYQPMRGFGRAWVDNPAVRTAIGWAVTFEEGYTMTYQWSSDYTPRLFLTWPDGTVISIVLYGDTGTWEYVG